MKKDAEAHADEDKKKKEEVDARNMADALIATAERALKDAEGKIPAELKTSVEEKITDLRKVKDAGSKEELKKASEELGTEMQKIGPAMGGTPGAAPEKPTEEPPKS